jgi:hypothetical protein
LPGSDAIDGANVSVVSSAGLTTDQRGYNRRVDRSGTVSALPDIGAFELGLIISTNDGGSDSNYTDGNLSLREALMLASYSPGKNEITFAPNVIGTIALASQLQVTTDVDILGPGANLLAIDAGGASRVFQINSGVNAMIGGLTITGGANVTLGGGVYNAGNLSLQSVVVDHNASTISGGGLYRTVGSLKIVGSTFSYNTALWGGGALVGSSDTTTGVLVQNSTFDHNTANYVSGSQGSGSGGGLFIASTTIAVPLLIQNSMFSTNYARQAAAVYATGSSTRLSIVSSTLTANEATIDSGSVGGILATQAQVTLTNTILAGNISDNTSLLDGNAINSGLITGSYDLLGQANQTIAIVDGINHNRAGTQANPLSPLLTSLGD